MSNALYIENIEDGNRCLCYSCWCWCIINTVEYKLVVFQVDSCSNILSLKADIWINLGGVKFHLSFTSIYELLYLK